MRSKILISIMLLAFTVNAFSADDCPESTPGTASVSRLMDAIEDSTAPKFEKRGYITPAEYQRLNSREIGEMIVRDLHRGCDHQRGGKEGPIVGDGSDIMMYVPFGAIPSIAKYGFQNQHVTRTTKGCDCREDRYAAETKLSGRYHGYSSEGKDVLPKYSALNVRTPENFSSPGSGSAGWYGDVVFVFNETVKKRSTWTVVDSLMAPKFRENTKANTLGLRDHRDVPFKCKGYCEAQIWGELDFTDVDYVIVKTETVPDSLKTTGIPVYLEASDTSSTGLKRGKLLVAGDDKIKRNPESGGAKPADTVAERVWIHRQLPAMKFTELKAELSRATADEEYRRELIGEIAVRGGPEAKGLMVKMLSENTTKDFLTRSQLYIGLSPHIKDKSVLDALKNKFKLSIDDGEEEESKLLMAILGDASLKTNKELQQYIQALIKDNASLKEWYEYVSGGAAHCPKPGSGAGISFW